ncbi:DUF1593 domain-containing protein [Arcicella sp. DC2W]|uniref:DUF1593 domain-containing protein n=1 Tax=Arcicella gelida TaxID=2984195 RepID=A0ABU5S465_9BACT|nr:DUF1593 domain-containing protein [Arcicella sp. DC2W]MEA5403294.1 DUF1593 domain-containing protein [Arcicella sp. DC2W]
MKIKLLFTVIFWMVFFELSNAQVNAQSTQLKPRIIVLTDVSTWETDDSESLVRLFAYADMFEIEGIVYTTGWSLDETRDDFFGLIHNTIDAYEKDLPNLMKRSNQNGHLSNENKQTVGYWPSANYLRERTVFGSKKRGIANIGQGYDSDGSNLIIKQADSDDKRPLWICLWGGGNTLAQAIWKVKNERSTEDLRTFLQKIPTYAITDQDRSYEKGTPFEISAQQWLRKDFEKSLVYLWDESAWLYQNGTGKKNWEEYEKNIQSHGNLGKVYPKYKYGVEGDTPSFLYLLPNGLNVPSNPSDVGWGGYFNWGVGPDNTSYSYTNHEGKAKEIASKYASYFYPAIFNDFAARMDWAKDGRGNSNPTVIINKSEGTDIIKLKPKSGTTLTLDASKSKDLDNNQLNYKWWFLSEASTYTGNLNITGANDAKASVNVPSNAIGTSIHIICEVKDNGEPHLTSYRRIILEPIK